MFRSLYEWIKRMAGGDDPSGPWPLRDEWRSVNDWYF